MHYFDDRNERACERFDRRSSKSSVKRSWILQKQFPKWQLNCIFSDFSAWTPHIMWGRSFLTVTSRSWQVEPDDYIFRKMKRPKMRIHKKPKKTCERFYRRLVGRSRLIYPTYSQPRKTPWKPLFSGFSKPATFFEKPRHWWQTMSLRISLRFFPEHLGRLRN